MNTYTCTCRSTQAQTRNKNYSRHPARSQDVSLHSWPDSIMRPRRISVPIVPPTLLSHSQRSRVQNSNEKEKEKEERKRNADDTTAFGTNHPNLPSPSRGTWPQSYTFLQLHFILFWILCLSSSENIKLWDLYSHHSKTLCLQAEITS